MTSTDTTTIDVLGLLDRPGEDRRLDLDLPAPAGLRLTDAEVRPPLHLDGVLESLLDGVLVRGTLGIALTLTCARCLDPVEDTVEAEVAELYSDPASSDDPDAIEEGFAIVDATIDLDALLRDAIAAAVPVAPRCRPDCQGLCPTCGANRNEVGCGCVEETHDLRWQALAGLRLPE